MWFDLITEESSKIDLKNYLKFEFDTMRISEINYLSPQN